MNNRTDFCDNCVLLRATANFPLLFMHLNQAKKQRDYINQKRRAVVQTFADFDNPVKQTCLISCDLSEKKRIPIFSDQPAQYYYMSGFTIDICGMLHETSHQQSNYLFPEGHWPQEKGISLIGSIWFHYFRHHPHAKVSERMIIVTDNCAGQNKNRWLVWLLASWIIVAQHSGNNTTEITQLFPIVGHTKFGPDRNFALISSATKKEAICTPSQLYDLVNSRCGKHNSAVCSSLVIFYDWKCFLEQFFDKTVPGIKSMHEFQYSIDHPGAVFVRVDSDSPFKRIDLMAAGVTVEHIRNPDGVKYFPLTVDKFKMPPKPIDDARQKQLDMILKHYGTLIGTKEEYQGPCTL